MDLHAAYRFILRFDSCVADRQFGTRLDFDPQRPPAEWGQPRQIVFEPLYPGLPFHSEDIPEGCLPVCCKARTLRFDGVETLAYRIGYQFPNGLQLYTDIKMPTGEKQPGWEKR